MKKIDKFYNNFKYPGSYSGKRSFFNTSKKFFTLSYNRLNNLLRTKDEYSLHKPVIKKFKRNKVYSYDIDYLWQADLVDLSRLARYNNGFKYLLTCIDVFSKYGWAIPIKSKSAESIYLAFTKIFKKRRPKKLQTDKGKEFLNKIFLNLLKSKKIHFYQINSDLKACVVERFNRTIKEKMWRYFTKKKSFVYLDIIDNLIKSYNNNYHRSIKMSPNEVNNENKNQVFKNLYGHINDSLIEFKFKKGDNVRIAKYKTVFDKGYTPNWTSEIFIINKLFIRNPPVYEIKDLQNQIIEGVFYENELQKIYK